MNFGFLQDDNTINNTGKWNPLDYKETRISNEDLELLIDQYKKGIIRIEKSDETITDILKKLVDKRPVLSSTLEANNKEIIENEEKIECIKKYNEIAMNNGIVDTDDKILNIINDKNKKLLCENDKIIECISQWTIEYKKITSSLIEIYPNGFANKCTICIDNTIDICLIPCGHCFCKECIDKSNENRAFMTTKCPMCRQEFTIQKLYIDQY